MLRCSTSTPNRAPVTINDYCLGAVAGNVYLSKVGHPSGPPTCGSLREAVPPLAEVSSYLIDRRQRRTIATIGRDRLRNNKMFGLGIDLAN